MAPGITGIGAVLVTLRVARRERHLVVGLVAWRSLPAVSLAAIIVAARVCGVSSPGRDAGAMRLGVSGPLDAAIDRDRKGVTERRLRTTQTPRSSRR
jgi:Zn-dependent alcohol dehydrogenase